jgi:hypothetical protein
VRYEIQDEGHGWRNGDELGWIQQLLDRGGSSYKVYMGFPVQIENTQDRSVENILRNSWQQERSNEENQV